VTFTIKAQYNDTLAPVTTSTRPTLDQKWQILRGDAAYRNFDNGRLRITVRNGDMIGGTATAQNVLLQPAPEGSWQATTKLDVSTLRPSGDQAGFILWKSENPNNFVKIVFIHKPDGVEWFEYVLTTNNSNARLPNTGAIANLPDEIYLRVVSDGDSTLTAQYSVDGEDWNAIGDPITELGTNVKVGLKVSAGSDAPNVARYDWFRVDCADRAAPRTGSRRRRRWRLTHCPE